MFLFKLGKKRMTEIDREGCLELGHGSCIASAFLGLMAD